MDVTAILREIDTQIEQLQKARAILAGATAPKRRGRPPKPASVASPAKSSRRRLSAAARAKIAAAQRKRWAEQKKKKGSSS